MRDILKGSGQERCWTEGIQDSWYAGKVGYSTGGMQYLRECRTGGMQERGMHERRM